MAKSGGKKDFSWIYAKFVDGENYFRCKFCDQLCSGSVHRFKHHLAGTHRGIKPCSKVPEDIKLQCQTILANFKEQKDRKNGLLQDIRMGPRIGSESFSSPPMEDIRTTGSGCGSSVAISTQQSKQPKTRDPMDDFITSRPPQTKQEERNEVCRKIGRFIFSSGLPFNVVNDPYWLPMCEGIASYGHGFKPPSAYELRTWILKEEVSNVNSMLDEHKESWKEYGCSIMLDGWTNGKSRYLINFLVNSPAGTWFLKSIDASDTIKNEELMFNYLDDVIEEIGEENVVQIITNNASNYENVGKRLMEKRKKLYWTPCAAHCIDLMLEDIGKMEVHATTLKQARQVVNFIYAHTGVLSMMRSFTKNQELIRPAITRFSKAYLTLLSIYKQKQPLQAMFSSEKFTSSSWAEKDEGVKARTTMLFDPQFWPHVAFCIKSAIPLVSVLREVDSEEFPAMAYIYDLMESAKEKIAFNCGGNIKKYGPIWNKINARWASQLNHPLHLAGYYLNPQVRYEDNFSNIEKVKEGLFECMDRMLDYNERLVVDVQFDQYDQAKGEFGSPMAIATKKLRSPDRWWTRFGYKTRELRKFALRVLSLTCSASGCERNWITFEMIHTKKRNILEHKRLNALVYVKYNTRLRERSIIRRQQHIDPLLVEEVDSDDEWIVEKEEPALQNVPIDTSWLDDDEFFDVDAIRTIPVSTYDRGELTRTSVVNIGSSSTSQKRKRDETS